MYQRFCLTNILGLCMVTSFLSCNVQAQDAILTQLYGYGVHSYFSRDYAAAYDYFSKPIAAKSEDPRPYYFRGLTLLNLGRPDQASKDFKAGAEREIKDSTGRYRIDYALERCQGPNRLKLETMRVDARLAAYERSARRDQLLYNDNLSAGRETLLPGDGPTLPAENLDVSGLDLDGSSSDAPNSDEPNLDNSDDNSGLFDDTESAPAAEGDAPAAVEGDAPADDNAGMDFGDEPVPATPDAADKSDDAPAEGNVDVEDAFGDADASADKPADAPAEGNADVEDAFGDADASADNPADKPAEGNADVDDVFGDTEAPADKNAEKPADEKPVDEPAAEKPADDKADADSPFAAETPAETKDAEPIKAEDVADPVADNEAPAADNAQQPAKDAEQPAKDAEKPAQEEDNPFGF